MSYPKISVITPSYNQGGFIEQTILSVIGQQYPNLEYIIIDGGSTDNTVEVIKKYGQYITYWISESDNGQADAINKGFERATGDILCWLNSDDYYLPGVLAKVAGLLDTSQPQLLFGNCIHLDESKNFTHGSYFDPQKPWDINTGDYITQPSSFWTRKAWEQTGPLNAELHFGFDWEWYARANHAGVKFIPSTVYFSVYRLHSQQKSQPQNAARATELLQLQRRLNPDKFKRIDDSVKTHKNGLNIIYALGATLPAVWQHRLLKVFYPGLMKLTDHSTLKKILQNDAVA
ncbi:glycosyltransferase family 2 protein [Mucilaginibacter sp. dw_454]|uniref:glycosyltransferase family 2 protein n=1 Tax=Mucilaginibacter sp. dw_454 TaxID=2720079 RepID=UPI001BD4D5BC|nr:glycosyltransferase family 2 protein [Mucilaginibacter sp. dw_454]